MSDEFKRRLEAYEKGELTGKELEEMEKDLEKLEAYQNILETESEDEKEPEIDKDKQRKIIKRGKWKARFQTAWTALGIIVILTVFSTIITGIYYSWGNPDRIDVYREVIDHTLTVTNPYGQYGGTSTGTSPFFGVEATRDLNKHVGKESVKVGELEVNFLFSLMAVPERTNYESSSGRWSTFTHPDYENIIGSDWNRLEELPEGTVVSAYVSFDELLGSSEVEQLFTNRNMDLLWLAVDTGASTIGDHGIIYDPIGFPNVPIWHEDDMILQSRKEEKFWFGSRVVEESSTSLAYEEGDEEMLHEQFMKTLYFLQDHERKADQLAFGRLNLDDSIDYLETNGIFHYGAVITGPTKEVLKLKEVPEISAIEVDEVTFWNWE